MTRTMLRSLALLAASAAAATGLLSGCGAGQITGTDSQVAPVPGRNLESSDGSILLRDLKIAYKDPAGYPQGGTASVMVLIYNTTRTPITLTGVQAQGGRVVLSGKGVVPSATPSASPTATPSVSGSPSRRPNGSTSPSAGVAPSSAPPSSAAPAPVGVSDIRITIPPNGFVRLSPDGDRYLQVTDLARALRGGGGLLMRLTFDNGAVIEANVPVATPLTPLPRSPIELPEEH